MSTSRVIVLKSIADTAARATSVISFPIIARYAGADGYGAYGQVTTLVGLVIPFASLGVTSAIVRFFVGGPWSKELVRRLSRTALLVLATTGIVSLFTYFSAAELGRLFIDWPSSTRLFQLSAVLITLGTLELFLLEVLRARGWLTEYVFFQLCQTLLIVGAIALLLPRGHGIIDLVVALCAIKTLLIVLAVAYIWTKPFGGETSSIRAVPMRALIRYGMPLSVSGLGLVLVNVGDRVVIGHYLEPEALGRYSAVYVMCSLLTLAGGPFFLPVYPRLMQATVSQRPDLIHQDIQLFHHYLSLALIPTAIFLGLIVQPVLVLMAGSAFQVATIIGYLIVAGIFLDQWNGLAHYLLMCNDRTVFLQNAWLGFGTLNIVINVFAVPAYGLEGAAVVTLITFLGLEIVIFRAAERVVPISRFYRWRTGGYALAASVVGGIAATLALDLVSAPFLRILSATAAFWLAYAASLLVSRQLGAKDIAILKLAFRPTGDTVPPDRSLHDGV